MFFFPKISPSVVLSVHQTCILLCLALLLSILFHPVLAWAAITNDHRWGGLNYRHSFLSFLEGGSSGSGCQQIWCLVRACFLISRWASSHCIVTWQRAKRSSFLGSLLVRALIQLMRALPWWPNYLPNTTPANTITLGI